MVRVIALTGRANWSANLQGLAVTPLFEPGKRALRVALDNITGTASFEDLFEGFGTHVYRIAKPTSD